MNEIPARLKPLILELQELPDWPATELPAGLILFDVLIALGMPKDEIEKILGHEVLTLVEGPTLQDAERTPSFQVC
jgi:(p)ppGpp synthase/HD superfamily hydrolase